VQGLRGFGEANDDPIVAEIGLVTPSLFLKRGLRRTVVAVAQLVELRVVIPAVVGSSPISHPKGRIAQLVEHRTLNPLVQGSNPCAPTRRPALSAGRLLFCRWRYLVKIVSWNVNGIRACAKKGFLEWLGESKPDVVLLQETKAWPEQLDAELLSDHGYHCSWAQAEKKGYSGVSTWSRNAPETVQVGLGLERFDREGRTVITDHGSLRIFNGYFPNGQRDHGRVPYKLDYYAAMFEAAEAARREGKLVLVSGDWNTAHRSIDLARPKQNRNTTGFLPQECAWMDRWFDAGYHDSFRCLHPEELGAYSWWSFRSGARQRNVGWRIDYHVISDELRPLLRSASIDSAILGSDHCPVVVEFDLTDL
jgi:exodeoxyribonuclease-3